MNEVEPGRQGDGFLAMGGRSTNSSLKLPPQNQEAELHVLGGLLMDPDSLEKVAEHLDPKDFYQKSHQQIYAGVLELSRQGTKADLITLTDFLQAQNSLQSVGGASYLASLVDLMPTSANIDSYAKLIREKSILRELIQVGTGIVEAAYQGGQNITEVLDQVERQVFQVAHRQMSQSTSSLREMVMLAFKSIQERFEKKSAVTGLATGFDGFDRLTSGLQKTDLVILAARPAVGKTAFALNLAMNVALREHAPTVVFSLEMSKDQLVQRLLAIEARVDGSRLRGGFLTDEDWPRLTHAASVLSEAPVYIDDTPGLSIFELRAKCRRLAKMPGGLGFVIVDYLQLMRVKGKIESREREIAEISMSLKALAKELNIPVLALSQLNRSLEARQDKRPVLSDLRESGSIEQDADLIMFLYRDEVYHPDTDSPGVAEVILAKHRHGPTGVSKLAFLKEYTRFENLADDDVIL
jgi:replicative DNA helicase